MNLKSVNLNTVLKKLTVLFLPLLLLSGEVKSAVNIETSATGLEVSEETIKSGMELFNTKCASCHAIDRRMTGPALKGVTDRHDMDWILKWVKNNQAFRESGDQAALAIYNEYNGAAMNIFEDLSDKDIKSIIMYVENGGWSDAPAKEEGAAAVQQEEADPKTVSNVNWMLLVIGLMIAIIVVFAAKILDLVSKITGRPVIKWNNVNATLMLIFLVAGLTGAIYETMIHGKYVLIRDAASEHGKEIDRMMTITLIITAFVFFVTQILLFWFSFKYRQKKGRKAVFYPENDRLEMAWTLIPAIVLTVLVIGGLNAWNRVMTEPSEDANEIELFAFQFGWQARYPGADGKLGNTNYNLISSSNPLGLAVEDQATSLIGDLENDILKYQADLDTLDYKLTKLKLSIGGLEGKKKDVVESQIDDIESGNAASELKLMIRRRRTQISRIQQGLAQETFFNNTSDDDIIVSEVHLVVNKPVVMRFRGRDVIHSAFMKDFRAQMNVVPGVPTHFQFVPTMTTKEKREAIGNNDFDYHVVCNKICGNSHFNMKLKIVVETQEEYDTWMREQNAFFAKEEAADTEMNEAPASEGTEADQQSEESEEETTEEMVEGQDLALNN